LLKVKMHTSNTLKTVILLSGLAGFMVLVGTLLGGTTGLVIGLLFGLGIVGASYWKSDKLAIKAARATEVAPGQLDWLRDDLAEIARRANMPTPRLFIAPDPQPNAFATGRNEQTAVVCVTAGLLQVLDRSEVRGVVAHEVAHIRNKDILIGSIAAAVATAISAIANLALFAGMFGGNSDDDGPNPAVTMLLAILAPMAAGLMQMALSRSREFEADRIGAELLGDPRPLAGALAKLDRISKQIPMDVDPAHATAYIVNPLTGAKQANFAKLFMTHPPMEERIARLLGVRAQVAA
jgi:heat shock protein HtpX